MGRVESCVALPAKPAPPTISNQVTSSALEAAVANVTLGRASLTVTYTRP